MNVIGQIFREPDSLSGVSNSGAETFNYRLHHCCNDRRPSANRRLLTHYEWRKTSALRLVPPAGLKGGADFTTVSPFHGAVRDLPLGCVEHARREMFV